MNIFYKYMRKPRVKYFFSFRGMHRRTTIILEEQNYFFDNMIFFSRKKGVKKRLCTIRRILGSSKLTFRMDLCFGGLFGLKIDNTKDAIIITTAKPYLRNRWVCVKRKPKKTGMCVFDKKC